MLQGDKSSYTDKQKRQAHTERAIISSSSVRMTRTVARLVFVELASRGLRIVRRIPHLRQGLDANPVFLMRFGNGSKVLA